MEEGHNQLQWAKVRRRAILRQTTVDDWELASDFQRKVIHQIELAIISVEDGHEDDTVRAGVSGQEREPSEG